jgi:hypothetical protein
MKVSLRVKLEALLCESTRNLRKQQIEVYCYDSNPKLADLLEVIDFLLILLLCVG